MKTLKKTLSAAIMLVMMLIASSCAYDMYVYDDVEIYVTGNQVTTIVSFGTPYYVDGYLRYYYYNGYYWYPYHYGGSTYLYRYHKPSIHHYNYVPSPRWRHSSATRTRTPNARPQSPYQSTPRIQGNLRTPSKPSHVIRQTQPSARSRQVAQPSRKR